MAVRWGWGDSCDVVVVGAPFAAPPDGFGGLALRTGPAVAAGLELMVAVGPGAGRWLAHAENSVAAHAAAATAHRPRTAGLAVGPIEALRARRGPDRFAPGIPCRVSQSEVITVSPPFFRPVAAPPPWSQPAPAAGQQAR